MSLLSGRLIASIVAAMVAAVPCAGRADVVAHWSFDRSLGTEGMYPDTANNAHPATPQDKSAVVPYDGKAPFGGGVTFNGSPGSYLNIPALTTIQKSSFTVAAWVNMTTKGPNFILTDWPATAQSGFVFGVDPLGRDKSKATTIVHLSGGGRNRPVVVRFPARDNSDTPDVPLNSWHHMAWIWERADAQHGTMRIFIDGNQIGSQAQSIRGSVDVALNQRGMRIGSREMPQSAGGPPVNFNGSIDELWVFDAALTNEQLNNLIKSNNIDGAPVVARVEPTPVVPAMPVAPTQATVNDAATPAVTPASDTAVPDAAPSVIPPKNNQPNDFTSAALSSSPVRASGGKTAGIIASLLWAIGLSSYLAWGIKERAKLKAAGKL